MAKKYDINIIRNWADGPEKLFVIVYNQCFLENMSHGGSSDFRAGKPEDVVEYARKTAQRLNSHSIAAETTEIYEVPKGGIFAKIRKQITSGQFEKQKERIPEELMLVCMDRIDQLKPVATVPPETMRFEPFYEEEWVRKALSARIHGFIDRYGAFDKNTGKKTFLFKSLPKGIREEIHMLAGYVDGMYNKEGYPPMTTCGFQIMDTPQLTPLAAFVDKLEAIHRSLFLRKVFLIEPEKDATLKTYRVAVHWEVAWVDDITAKSTEEAYDKAREMARNAPSSDYQWLEETEVEVNEIHKDNE